MAAQDRWFDLPSSNQKYQINPGLGLVKAGRSLILSPVSDGDGGRVYKLTFDVRGDVALSFEQLIAETFPDGVPQEPEKPASVNPSDPEWVGELPVIHTEFPSSLNTSEPVRSVETATESEAESTPVADDLPPASTANVSELLQLPTTKINSGLPPVESSSTGTDSDASIVQPDAGPVPVSDDRPVTETQSDVSPTVEVSEQPTAVSESDTASGLPTSIEPSGESPATTISPADSDRVADESGAVSNDQVPEPVTEPVNDVPMVEPTPAVVEETPAESTTADVVAVEPEPVKEPSDAVVTSSDIVSANAAPGEVLSETPSSEAENPIVDVPEPAESVRNDGAVGDETPVVVDPPAVNDQPTVSGSDGSGTVESVDVIPEAPESPTNDVSAESDPTVVPASESPAESDSEPPSDAPADAASVIPAEPPVEGLEESPEPPKPRKLTTAESARLVQDRLAAGDTVADLAVRFKTSEATINKLANMKV